jgi:hypothetical protein
VARGEMTPPELAEFQNENEKENENEYSFVSSSLHHLIPSSLHHLIPSSTHHLITLLHHRMATNKQYLSSRKLKTTLNLLMRQEPWCLLEDAKNRGFLCNFFTI